MREVDKDLLSKEVPVKRQDGVRHRKENTGETGAEFPAEGIVVPPPRHHHSHKADIDGFFHRKTDPDGMVKLNKVSFNFGVGFASIYVLLKVVGNQLHVFDEEKQLFAGINVREGRRY